MDEKTRLAVRQAAASNAPTVAAKAAPTIDSYRREASALLCVKLSRREVRSRVEHRMGLSAVHEQSSQDVQTWHITQSTKYTHLRVSFTGDHVSSWELVAKEG